jgi:hypothetical protein
VKFVLHHITKEPLVFSEMKVSHYKDLLKCTFGDEPSTESFIETFYDILAEMGTKEREFYKNLSIYTLFQILTELRLQAFGNECIVRVSKDNTNCSLHLDLVSLLQDIKAVIGQFEESAISDDGISVCFSTPTVVRLSDKVEEEYICFIKSVTVKDKTILIEDNETAKMLIDNLTPKLGLKVIDHYNDFVSSLTKYNLLERYGITDQKLIFVPTLENLLWYCKLYFSEPLDTFYENLFFLSHHGKIEASYIETCTPGEYIFLAKKLAATLKERNSNNDEDLQQ